MAKRAFGELEIQILNFFKEGKHLTVKEVHRLLGGQDNYNTIMTVMNRLVEKKQLVRNRIGLQYEYWIGEAAEQIPSLLDKIKQKFSGLRTKALVARLIEEDQTITDEELAEMERFIQEKRNKK